jgi:hypothetical protein
MRSDGRSTFLQNAVKPLSCYKASHPRRVLNHSCPCYSSQKQKPNYLKERYISKETLNAIRNREYDIK